MTNDERDEASQEDLKDVLTTFWLDAMRDADNTWPERIKSSELLAKYILGEGKTTIKRRGSLRPATAEILKLAAELEKGNGFSYKELDEAIDETPEDEEPS